MAATYLKGNDISDIVLPASDFSFFNCPGDSSKVTGLFKNIYNIPVPRHVAFIFTRDSRGTKIDALSNLSLYKGSGLQYLDSVSITYERSSTPSGAGFLQLSEDVHIFYKGLPPNIKNTGWFRDDRNASNHWDVTPAENEGRPHTYCKKFAWEVGLLAATLSAPANILKFIYGLDSDTEHVVKFADEYGYSPIICTTK